MAVDPCCQNIAGGRIAISVGENVFEGRGDCEIEPRNTENEAEATSSGKMYAMVRAKLFRMRIPYANLCERDPLDLWDFRCKVDLTVEEIDRGYRHIFIDAIIVGTPVVNLSTGEATGIEIATDKYRRVVN